MLSSLYSANKPQYAILEHPTRPMDEARYTVYGTVISAQSGALIKPYLRSCSNHDTRMTKNKNTTSRQKRGSPSANLAGAYSARIQYPLPPPQGSVPLHASQQPSRTRSTAPSHPILPPPRPRYRLASSLSVRHPCPASGKRPWPRHAASESRPCPRPCSESWACLPPACR